jgi:hypothetical protein
LHGVTGSSPRVAVFGSSALLPDDPGWAEADRLGATLAAAGCTVVTGGYAGVMEAVSAGAASAGGRVVGITAPEVFPDRSSPNAHLTDEVPAPTIPLRIATLLDGTDAAVALPGSIGTLAELIVSWNVRFVARHGVSPDLVVVAVGTDWGDLVPILANRLAIPLELVELVETIGEAGALVLDRLGLVKPGNPASDYSPAARMEPQTQ